MTAPTFVVIVIALITGLSDYSTDQRGDVGSWIRIAALNALGETLAMARLHETARIPQHIFEDAIGGVVKQAVEKLEPVREAAALALAKLRVADAQQIWIWEGDKALVFTPGDNG